MNGIGISALTDGFALGLVLKATVVLCVAGVVTLFLPRASAAARHLVWTSAVIGLVSLPVLSMLLPSWEVPIERIAAMQDAGPWRMDSEPAPVPTPGETPGNLPAPGVWQAPPPDGSLAAASAASGRLPWHAWIFAIWAFGALALLIRLMLGWYGVRRLSRSSEEVTDPEWLQLLKDATWMVGVERKVRLIRSSLASMPMTWGTLRPTVLIPAEAEAWPVERRRVVLLHEVAHVARGDCLTQTLADLACALYWFHPLTWIAARRLRAERERACDDQVLRAGERASEYASHLLEVARAFRPVRPAGAAAIAMARPSQLEGRLLAVLDTSRSRASPGPHARAAAVALAALVLLPISAVRTVPAHAGDLTAEPWAPASEAWAETPLQGGAPVEPAPTEPGDRVIERQVAARPGEYVLLNLATGGEVRIVGWDRESVAVRAVLRGRDLDNSSVELTQRSGGVSLTSEYRGSVRNRRTSHHFEVQVPNRSNLQIHSAGGEVSIERVRGTLSGATGGGAIRLRNVAGSASLQTGGGEIRVSDTELDGELRSGGGEIRIVNNRGSLQGFTGGGDLHADQTAPAGVGAQAANRDDILHFHTGGGEVRISHAPRSVDVSTGGGDILIRSAANRVRVRSGNGDVSIGSAGGSVEVHAGNGDVHIGSAAGPVKVVTGSGDVSVTVADRAGTRDVEINSGYGDVTLVLPATFAGDFDIEITGSGGSIHSDFDVRRAGGITRSEQRLRGRTGNGSNRVQIRTTNGDVVIRRAAARAAGAAAARGPDLPGPPQARENGATSSRMPPPMPAPTAAPAPMPVATRTEIDFDGGLDAFIDQAVEFGIQVAGQALSDAEVGKLIEKIALRATRLALNSANHALTVEERRQIEHQVRRETDAVVRNHISASSRTTGSTSTDTRSRRQ